MISCHLTGRIYFITLVLLLRFRLNDAYCVITLYLVAFQQLSRITSYEQIDLASIRAKVRLLTATGRQQHAVTSDEPIPGDIAPSCLRHI